MAITFPRPSIVSETFTAVGAGTNSREFGMYGDFNVSLDFSTGTAVGATMQLQRKLPGESDFTAVTYSDGSALGPFTAAMNSGWSESESGALYRWYCAAITSGTVTGRISQ